MMTQFKKYVSLLLILVLTVSVFAACGKTEDALVTEAATVTEAASGEIPETTEAQAPAEPAGFYQVGDKVEDFTITTYDGKEVSLYQVLEQKDMVLLNLWATWCGPCGSEFPAMQEAYEKYQDKVEIIALSTEPTDTDEVLADYAEEKGMTFCVARDTADFGSRIDHSGIPTTVVVDRFGTICLIEEGAVPDSAVFTNLFERYTAEDYTESLILPNMYAQVPDVQPADPEELNAALNGEGGNLVFTNSSDKYNWPMTLEQKDGRTVAVASNTNSQYSKAVVETQVDVKAGDVLVVEYKLENDIYLNTMSVEVDGECVKKTYLGRDWGTFAYSFAEEGNHQVRVCFNVEITVEGYNSNLWIDSIRIVSGDDAAMALEANPKYPVGKETQIQILNENVKKAYYYEESDPDAKQAVYFCTDPTFQLLITLDETLDPENTYLTDGGNLVYFVASYATEDGFMVEIPNSGPESLTSGAVLYCGDEAYAGLDIFNSEEQINHLCDLYLEKLGMSLKWEYWDESVEILEISGDVTYTVTYVDQNGDPVPGVMCQVCDESMCQVFVSDANGICMFTLPAKRYEIHTLKVPEGYEGDTTTVTKAPAQGGALSFTLIKK